MAMVMPAAHCLSQILNVRELPALRGGGEIRRKLGELICRCRIAALLRRLGGALQIRGDLLRDLLVFGWVRLLKLLEFAQQLCEGRKLGAVRLWLDGRSIDAV